MGKKIELKHGQLTSKVSLTVEELTELQTVRTEMGQKQFELGNLVMLQHDVVKKIESYRLRISSFERNILSKYGEGAIVNIETGEITFKNVKNDTE
jgi:hypothetical protein